MTKEYETIVLPILKEISHISSSIPLFWAIALGSYPRLRKHLSQDDIPYLTHITNISYHPRPSYTSGFYLALHLDGTYKRATLVRTFSLSSTTTNVSLIQPSSSENGISDAFLKAAQEINDHPSFKLIATGFISLPHIPSQSSETSRLSYSSTSGFTISSGKEAKGEELLFLQAKIRQCSFFTYFISSMSLNAAEAITKEFLPNIVRYYAIGSKEELVIPEQTWVRFNRI